MAEIPTALLVAVAALIVMVLALAGVVYLQARRLDAMSERLNGHSSWLYSLSARADSARKRMDQLDRAQGGAAPAPASEACTDPAGHNFVNGGAFYICTRCNREADDLGRVIS